MENDGNTVGGSDSTDVKSTRDGTGDRGLLISVGDTLSYLSQIQD